MTIAIVPAGGSRGSARDGEPTSTTAREPGVADRWWDAVAKLVPGEVLLGYAVALQLPGVAGSRDAHLAILVGLALVTPAALWASARHARRRAPWLQYVVRTLALVLLGLSFGDEHALSGCLGTLRWVPAPAALAVVVLAALVLVPPGAQGPPPPRARST